MRWGGGSWRPRSTTVRAAIQDEARRGKVRQGMARQGKATQVTTRQDNNRNRNTREAGLFKTQAGGRPHRLLTTLYPLPRRSPPFLGTSLGTPVVHAAGLKKPLLTQTTYPCCARHLPGDVTVNLLGKPVPHRLHAQVILTHVLERRRHHHLFSFLFSYVAELNMEAIFRPQGARASR